MTSAAVSNVLAPAQPVNSNAKDTTKVAEEQDIVFQSLLKNPKQSDGKLTQTVAPTAQTVSSDKDAGVKQSDPAMAQTGSKRDAVKIDDGTKKKELTKDEVDKAEKAVSEFSEKTVAALKEELDVTDEEIEEAMETLGLTFLDLAQPENLISLVTELTETAEPLDLLTNPSLNGIMDQVSELVTNLTEEAGIPLETLTAIGMTETDENRTEEFTLPVMEEAVSTDAPTVENAPVFTEAVETVENPDETIAPEEEAPVVRSGAEHTVIREDTEAQDDAPIESEAVRTQPVEVEETRTADQNTDAGTDTETGADSGKSFTGTANETKTTAKENHENVAHAQQANDAQPVQEVAEEVEAPRPVVDVQELMDQFAEFARTNISADTTSIEMRLNPENLGRLLINVQEQEGAVRATIQTQNEQVKEALEGQLIILRSTLEGQGIKVTEVEVTVASHEFEENLEKGNTENQTGEQNENGHEAERNANGTRRNLNLNDLDGLQGLMTEEEQLAAQIMRDNGNSVDFTA